MSANQLAYLRRKALWAAVDLYADALLLRQELGTVYGSPMTAGDLTHQRTECAALMDTCIDFARYMGTPEAWAEGKQAEGRPSGYAPSPEVEALRAAAGTLWEACMTADEAGDLPPQIDGGLLDDVNLAVIALSPWRKGGPK